MRKTERKLGPTVLEQRPLDRWDQSGDVWPECPQPCLEKTKHSRNTSYPLERPGTMQECYWSVAGTLLEFSWEHFWNVLLTRTLSLQECPWKIKKKFQGDWICLVCLVEFPGENKKHGSTTDHHKTASEQTNRWCPNDRWDQSPQLCLEEQNTAFHIHCQAWWWRDEVWGCPGPTGPWTPLNTRTF